MQDCTHNLSPSSTCPSSLSPNRSIAGCELRMPTMIGPAHRLQYVLVPAQAIRELQRTGIAFHML